MPSFLVLWTTLAWLTKRPLPTHTKRRITTSIGLGLTAAPFLVFYAAYHPYWRPIAGLATFYAAPIIACTWLYKFPPQPPQPTRST